MSKTFLHSGDLGDIILSLPTIRALGGGTLYLGPSTFHPNQDTFPRETMTPRSVKFLKPLLEAQSYIHQVKCYYGGPVDYDLNKFRFCGLDLTKTNLCYAHLYAFGLLPQAAESPWLEVPKLPVRYEVVINRSSRNHGDLNYYKAVGQRNAIFLGHEDEYEAFTFEYPGMRIRWHRCFDAMEIAQIINSAQLFVGNQSLCYTIAKGLGKETILEEGPLQNCRW